MIASGLWKGTLLGIRTKFSDVTHVETNDVNDKLEDDKQKLLDCRDKNEYDVSRIPGASHMDPNCTDCELINAVKSLPSDTTVVCYCSVGYRSSVMARRIKRITEKESPTISVVNMEGSIFKWANESRPLVDADGNSTNLVHPYNTIWGKMLNEQLWSPF